MNIALLKIIISFGFGLGMVVGLGLAAFLLYVKPLILGRLVKQLKSIGVSNEDSQVLYLEARLNIITFYKEVQELAEAFAKAHPERVMPKPDKKRFFSFEILGKLAIILGKIVLMLLRILIIIKKSVKRIYKRTKSKIRRLFKWK